MCFWFSKWILFRRIHEVVVKKIPRTLVRKFGVCSEILNKRPKGPHIVHLRTMCHLFKESTKADIFVYWSAQKTQTRKRMLRSCFLSSFVEFRSAVSEEKSKNVSANQRPGRPSCFSDRPEKHKLGRGRWDLASCQVSLNSVQRFQRRSWKCLSQSEARAAIFLYRSARKTQIW